MFDPGPLRGGYSGAVDGGLKRKLGASGLTSGAGRMDWGGEV